MANSAVQLELNEFLDELLSVDCPPSARTESGNPFVALQNADDISAKDISKLFIEAINTDQLAPGFHTSSFAPECQRTHVSDLQCSNFAIFRGSSEAQSLWFDQIIPIVFRRYCPRVDPFEDLQSSNASGEMKHDMKQLFDELSDSAELLFAAQHRVFLFMFLVIGRRFRLLRWDRAGVVASPSIDYVQNPTILHNFLYRICLLEDDSLGFDPTATRVLSSDVDFWRMDSEAMPHATDVDHSERKVEDGEVGESSTFAYTRSLFRTSLASRWPRYRLEVQDGDEKRRFLVSKPVFCADGIAGRGTRGYVAFDCTSRRFVWLKDAWRASYKVVDREGDILAKLNAAKVSNIPTLVCHGDVPGQTTITADWLERRSALSSTTLHSSPTTTSFSSSSTTLSASGSPSSKKRKRANEPADETPGVHLDGSSTHATHHSLGPLRQHTHYRIVVKEVCLPLKDFQYGQQLVALVLDCMDAHFEAATKPETRVLHGDISSGNILIYPKVFRREDGIQSLIWTGTLTDWELSKQIDAQEAASRDTRANRTGTYQFMSVNLLTDLKSPIQISDELESFFHVLVYYAVRYLDSNCEGISSFVRAYFNAYDGPGCMFPCGQKSVIMESLGALYTQIPYKPLRFYSPMDVLLAQMLKSLRAHYKVLQYEWTKASLALFPTQRWSPSPFINCDGNSHVPPAPTTLDQPAPGIPNVDREVDDDDEIPLHCIPTPDDIQLASKVAEHKFFLSYMVHVLDHRGWSTDDRRPADSLAPPAPSTPSTSNKRRRTTGPERPTVSRMRTRTCRTRPAARTLPVKPAKSSR